MNPSEMSDTELNRAIAKELGHKQCSCGRFHMGTFHADVDTPNYTSDVAASMGLMTEKDWQYNINNGYVSIYPHTEQFWHNNTIEGIARAISEAWYSARREE